MFPTSGSFNDTPDSVPPAFNTFKPVTEDEVSKCIDESCPLYPIPTFLSYFTRSIYYQVGKLLSH